MYPGPIYECKYNAGNAFGLQFAAVPGQSCEEESHAAKVGDTGKNEARADKSSQAIEAAIYKTSQKYPDKYQ